MKKIIVAAAAAILATSGAMASAVTTCDIITITSGGAKGNFFRVTAVNAKKKLLEAGAKKVVIEKSGGTVDNLYKTYENPCWIGIGQADAIIQEMENSEKIESLEFLGNAGKEAVFVVVKKKYIYEPNKRKVLMGGEGSGTNVTTAYLKSQGNVWLSGDNKKIVSKEYSYAKVTGYFYSAGIFVNAPDPRSEKIKQILKNDDLAFFPIAEENTNLGPLGEGDDAIYTFAEVDIGDTKKLPTVLVQDMFFYNPKGVNKEFKSIVETALAQVNNIEESLFEKGLNKMKKMIEGTKAYAWDLKKSLSKMKK